MVNKVTKKTGTKKPGVSKAEFNELKNTVDSVASSVNALVESLSARNNPVNSTRRVMDTDDADSIGQDHERSMSSTGPALESLEPARIDIVDGPVSADKLMEEKFMQDLLTVEVHETNDPTADPVPCVTVNGHNQFFIRGRKQEVRRMFVERLLRLKHTSYTQRKEKDADGNDKYIQIPHTTLLFPFAVHHDPAGQKGRDWYSKLRQEA